MTAAATTLPSLSSPSSPSLSSLLPARFLDRLRSAGRRRWRPGFAPTDRNFVINLQDVARFGPNGALDVLFAWAHPRCSRGEQMRLPSWERVNAA